MRLRKADAAHLPQLRRGIPVGGFVWFAGAAALFAATLGATASAIGPYQVAPDRRFSGFLTARPDAMRVDLSPGLPVAHFLAREGDSVSAGDVIAIYDLTALAAQIEKVEAQSRTLRLHRDCLIGLLRPDEGLLIATVRGHEERQALRLALRSCALERASVRHATEAATTERDRRTAELALIDHGLEQQGAPDTANPAPATSRARLAVTRSVLATRLREAEQRLSMARITAAQGLLNRVRHLSEDLRALQSERDRLVAARDRPGIVAPSTGILAGLGWAGENGQSLEVQGSAPAVLTADVLIPSQEIQSLDLSAPVLVDCPAGQGREENMVGSVTSVTAPSADGMSRVLVRITGGDQPLHDRVLTKAPGAQATLIAELRFAARPVALSTLMSNQLAGLSSRGTETDLATGSNETVASRVRLSASGF